MVLTVRKYLTSTILNKRLFERLYNATYDDTTYQQTQESVLRMGFDYADALYQYCCQIRALNFYSCLLSANIPEFEDADFSHNNEWIAYKAQECISNALAVTHLI